MYGPAWIGRDEWELGFLSGRADFNQDFAGDVGVCSDGECFVDVVDRQYVGDHLLDLRVLVEEGDGGVDSGVEAEGAEQQRVERLRHPGAFQGDVEVILRQLLHTDLDGSDRYWAGCAQHPGALQ